MSADALQSRTFERASLKSESQRVWTLLAVLIALLVFVILRGLATQSYLLLAAQTVTLVLVIAHETVMLRAIKAALRDDETVKPELWVFNVFVKSQLPTLALFLLLMTGWVTPYQVLVAPAIAIYFLFITLSTLRLSPSLTLTTGLLSALGYLFVTFYVHARYQDSAGPETFPFFVYLVYGGLILIAGVVGAVVAYQVRGYVIATLREAKLHAELEKINQPIKPEATTSIGKCCLTANSLSASATQLVTALVQLWSARCAARMHARVSSSIKNTIAFSNNSMACCRTIWPTIVL